MNKLRYFDFYKSYQLVDLMCYDLNSSNGNLSKEDVVVYQKFVELSDKVAMGNYFVKSVESNDRISIQYFNLCSAITAYNDCYDYFRQIVYWGFGFFDDFNTSEQYLKQLKKCIEFKNEHDKSTGKMLKVDSDFIALSKKYQEVCSDFNMFMKQYNKYQGFVSDPKIGIRQIANRIKHQGGFITVEMYNKHRFNNLYFTSNSGENIFDAKQMYDNLFTTEQVLMRLYNQNEKIVEISFWLFEQFFPQRKISAFVTHSLPKSKILLVNDSK